MVQAHAKAADACKEFHGRWLHKAKSTKILRIWEGSSP